MVFKPFKPPLMRSNVSNPIEITDEPTRPVKKPRLDEEPAPAAQSTPLANRKPLLQVSNRGADTKQETSDAQPKDDKPDEKYFNVLWRKPTAKKHKTWDGDGIISVRRGNVFLRDATGKEMGRRVHETPVEPGVSFSISGKEVEVESEITREEYYSGRRFLEPPKPATPDPTPAKKELPARKKGEAPKPTAAERTASLKRSIALVTNPDANPGNAPGAFAARLGRLSHGMIRKHQVHWLCRDRSLCRREDRWSMLWLTRF
ncbi:unnamed protein product [Penicillium olsonii]|uniref:DUF2439 domain-containing protein n=1 Tax=Penicillium olsonii TaxID=99116 RepID=A0A9W4MLE3_PENOL|nr:unnamed protein product [Penicillium olsonii]CAG8057289.1 unnamed protein product [Penicillium olsonii]